jgi:hypothetical protein
MVRALNIFKTKSSPNSELKSCSTVLLSHPKGLVTCQASQKNIFDGESMARLDIDSVQQAFSSAIDVLLSSRRVAFPSVGFSIFLSATIVIL